MERINEIWQASLLGRLLGAVCRWFGGQWRSSGVVRAFVAPMTGEETSRGSVFYRIWALVLGLLRRLYAPKFGS